MKDDAISMRELEEGKELQLDFEKMKKVVAQSPDVIPVAVQNINTKEVYIEDQILWFSSMVYL